MVDIVSVKGNPDFQKNNESFKGVKVMLLGAQGRERVQGEIALLEVDGTFYLNILHFDNPDGNEEPVGDRYTLHAVNLNELFEAAGLPAGLLVAQASPFDELLAALGE